MTESATIREFAAMIGALHDGGEYSYLWTSPAKKTRWWRCGDGIPSLDAPGQNIYFGVHPTARIPDKDKNGAPAVPENVRGRVEDIACINALFAEFDCKTDKAGKLARLCALPISPTLIVDSGGGYHCYWLLTETIYLDGGPQRRDIIDLQARWVDFLGSDKAAKDLARVLRVPGTLNLKPEYDPPPMVIIVGGSGERYPVEALREYVGESAARPPIERDEAEHGGHQSIIDYARVLAGGKTPTADILVMLRAAADRRTLELGERTKADDELRLAVEWVLSHTDTDGITGTDADNANRFVSEHGENIRWCNPLESWLVWDGRYWKPNSALAVERLAENTARDIIASSAKLPAKQAKEVSAIGSSLLSQGRMLSMINASKRKAEVELEKLNDDRGFLTCANGVLDLRRGALLPFEKSRYSTRMTDVTYNPEAKCPRWGAFLRWIMADNLSMIAWLQRAVGYTLTGHGDAKMFAYLTGGGDNGKTTFLETVRMACGKYSQKISVQALLTGGKHGEQKNTPYTAVIEGARFVVTDEMPPTARLNTSVIKDWTGGEVLTAMAKYEPPHDFKQGMFLWMYGNSKPKVGDETDAMWGRIRLVEFPVTIPEEKRRPMERVLAEFREELPGILAWGVEGAFVALEEGVGTTDDIKRDTAEYRQAQDIVGNWLKAECEKHPDYRLPKDKGYKAFGAWCKDELLAPLGKIALTNRLKGLGVPVGGHGNSEYVGVKLAGD